MTRFKFPVALLALVFMMCFASASFADTNSDVETIVKQIEKADMSEIWNYGYKLEEMAADKAKSEDVRKALKGILEEAFNPKIIMVCGKVLCSLGDTETAFKELSLVVRNGKEDETRIMAVNIMGMYAKDVETLSVIYNLARQDITPAVNIANGRALWDGYMRTMAVYPMVDELIETIKGRLKVYLDSDNASVRNESAFLLAEMGDTKAAESVLKKIASAPTVDGKRAANILRGYPLINEVISNIKDFYVDEEKTGDNNLIEGAAKGIVDSLDPFSSYMDEETTKRFNDQMGQEFAGIGAYVDIRDKVLTISNPIYGGPAYEIGLRSMDRITAIEGERTYGKTMDELIPKLKGKPGTPVKLKIYRTGWGKERDFVIIRRMVQVPSVIYNMLPGKIGYIRLTQFGKNADKEVADALADLEQQGLKGLVFDLRDNGGGLMIAAINIVSNFIENGKVVLSEKGRKGVVDERIFRSNSINPRLDLPLVILVNEGSASASEITAGALKDYNRAVLVGERTFGKGSVQNLISMKTTNGKSRLRLTIAKYYLPSGKCIHRTEKDRGGIKVDVNVAFEESEPWKEFELMEIRNSDTIEKYVDSFYEKNKELCRQLAEYDGYDTSKYPGFKEWADSLKLKTLEHNDLRRLVRSLLRKKVADEDKTPSGGDFEEDNQLQAAIVEVFKKMKADPEKVPEYKGMPGKIKIKEEDEEDKDK